MTIKSIITSFLEFITLALARWKVLSAYLIFSVFVLSGWYVDIMGAFSSQEDYAARLVRQVNGHAPFYLL